MTRRATAPPVPLLDLADHAARLERRYRTDIALLEEVEEEILALGEYLDEHGADREYARRCAALVNMCAHITGAELWEEIRRYYNEDTCILDLSEVRLIRNRGKSAKS